MRNIVASVRERRQSTIARRWLAFALCLLAIWVFMFIIAPMVQKLPAARSLALHIEESGINASALFYTGVDEAAEAEMYLHNAAKFPPAGQ